MMLCLLRSAHASNKPPTVYLLKLVHLSVLSGGDFAVEKGPKPDAEGLAGIPEPRKAVMGPVEETHVLHELCSGACYSTAGRESDVNESKLSLN